MDKRYLSPEELLGIATQHAYAAELILENYANKRHHGLEAVNSLAPVATLMYQAFQLTFKAYLLHDHRPVKQYRSLRELVEMNSHLGFSGQQQALLRTLSQEHAFAKGIAYDLWENSQQLQVFCEEILDLYEHLQTVMPLELQKDYHDY